MSIWITGDTHGDFTRFNTSNFPRQKEMGREDCVIVTGDFGGIWDGSKRDKYWLDWLEGKPFTTLFVDGNHENFDALYTLPVKEWHGGKVHEARPNVLHLMRGQVFEIGGLTFFTMGGATSHDVRDGILDPADPNFEQKYWFKRRTRQCFRVKGVSWWPEELPGEGEYTEAIHNLEQAGWDVDVILTHCAPTSIQQKIDPDYVADELTDFLQMVKRRCSFSKWFLGHYHRNMDIGEKFILQWENIVQIKGE